MRKIKEIVEDVVATVSHIGTGTRSVFETQIAECSALLVTKHTAYEHVVGTAKFTRANSSIVVKLDMYDSVKHTKPAAQFEHSFTLDRKTPF